MNNDELMHQMDLNFDLINTSHTANFVETNSYFPSASATVISFHDAISKREEERQATLYRQITSSISHLRKHL